MNTDQEGALESYLTAWRDADPLHVYAWLFLHRVERIRYGGCAALVQEWWKILHGVREPQVAVAKLGWWREELQRAAADAARHPLTQSLFADARVREVPLSCWTAVVDAALLAIDLPPSADFPAQQRAVSPLAAAVAELETRIWFDPWTESPRAAAVAVIAHLAADTRALAGDAGRGCSPLPMNLLARHALTSEQLAVDGAARRAALRDYAGLLHNALADAATLTGSLTLFRAVGLQHDLHTLERAARADDPLPALRAPGAGFRPLLKTWRAARTWRRASNIEAKA